MSACLSSSRICSTRAVCYGLALLALGAACGGGDSAPTRPTPPVDTTTPFNPVVSAIDVSPVSAALAVPGTLQITATPRNAQGQVVPGQTLSWASSANAVATVSQSGLVTAVAAGTAIITASSGSVSGSASITVTASTAYGPVVARGTIGSAGGTVGTTDVAITIPAGAFTTTNAISLIRDTVSANTVGANASARYLVDGLPRGQTVDVRVRLRTTGTGTGARAIGAMRPATALADRVRNVMGLTLVTATDSSGYLVATVPMAGRPAAWNSGLTPRITSGALRSSGMRGSLTTRALAGESDAEILGFLADVAIAGFNNLTYQRSTSGTFDVWGLAIAPTDPDMPAKVQRTAQLLDQGHARLTGELGYSVAHRTKWPLQVIVRSMEPEYGGLFEFSEYPYDPNTTNIAYNRDFANDADYPGIVMHELYHFMQTAYNNNLDSEIFLDGYWLQEATATWAMELHPGSPSPYRNSTALYHHDSLFNGLNENTEGPAGYGKAPIFKYIAKRWGNNQVKQIWSNVRARKHPIDALIEGVPEPLGTWWPLALQQYFGGSLYPWTLTELMPTPPVEAIRPLLGLWPYRRPDDGSGTLTLGTRLGMLERDANMFGVNYRLPVFLRPDQRGDSKLQVYGKTAAATHYSPIVGGDTVRIPGTTLRQAGPIMLALTSVRSDWTATAQPLEFMIDLRLPNGDWHFPLITGVNNGFTFACDREGESVTIDPAENAEDLWGIMSTAGVWTWQENAPTTYAWNVSPQWADSLTRYGVTIQSTLTANTDNSVRVQGRFVLDPPASLRVGASGSTRADTRDGTTPTTSGASVWWLIVPVALAGVGVRRRTRRFLPPLAAVSLLLLANCSAGQISLRLDESFDYTFSSVTFTADSTRPNDPQLLLNDGTGRTVMNSYRSEYWKYLYTNSIKTDSVKVACTGSGSSSYSVSGMGFLDGKTPPGDDDDLTQLRDRVTRSLGSKADSNR